MSSGLADERTRRALHQHRCSRASTLRRRRNEGKIHWIQEEVGGLAVVSTQKAVQAPSLSIISVRAPPTSPFSLLVPTSRRETRGVLLLYVLSCCAIQPGTGRAPI